MPFETSDNQILLSAILDLRDNNLARMCVEISVSQILLSKILRLRLILTELILMVEPSKTRITLLSKN